MTSYTYTNSSIKPDKLYNALWVLYGTILLSNGEKKTETNSLDTIHVNETGNIYLYGVHVEVTIKNININIELEEEFHSFTTNSIDENTRGTTFTNIHVYVNDIEEVERHVFEKFINLLNELMNQQICDIQKKYDSIYYWENPSYYENSEPDYESTNQYRDINYIVDQQPEYNDYIDYVYYKHEEYADF